jgi:hypothetical protein
MHSLAKPRGFRYKVGSPLGIFNSFGFAGRLIMVFRPRTPYVKALKQKRCPKCGTLVNRRVRCKVCHKRLKP